MRRIHLLAFLLLACAALALAEDADYSQRYLILDTHRKSTMQRELDDAAAHGFRVFGGNAGYKFILLEQDRGLRKHQYEMVDNYFRTLKKGEEKGFRFLATTFAPAVGSSGVIMEKLQPDEPQSEYKVVDTVYTRNMLKDVNELAAQGYEIVAMPTCADFHQLLMERKPGVTSGPADRYRMIAANKTSTVEKELATAVADGYRIVGSNGMGNEMVVFLERRAADERKPEYRLLSTTRAETMEAEMNRAVADGYVMLPGTMSALRKGNSWVGDWGYEIAVVMVKAPAGPHYHLLATNLIGTLKRELAEATTAEGYDVTGIMLSYTGQIIILEKGAH